MAIIRFLLKIPAILLMLICRIITVVIDLAAKVSCLVLGPITVFILGCVVYTICKDVKSIRQQSLMSQEAFAQAIGVSFTTVNRWETGKCKPSYKTIKQLSEFCKENDIAIDTYEHNYGHRPQNLNLGEADISEIRNALDLKDGNELILIGCAPCQGFSSHRKKDHRGPDSRNTLVGRFAEIAVELNPKMIIMENVPDLLAKKHWHHYQAFKDTVEAAGYHIAVKILGMADYGTPQSRFRTVLIAARDFIPTLPEPVGKAEDRQGIQKWI